MAFAARRGMGRWLIVLVLVGCGNSTLGGSGGSGGGSGGAGGSSGSGGSGGGGPFMDFPAGPIIDTGAPANSGTLFGGQGAGSGGPCLIEPEPGTLFPRNWLRPRFTWIAASGENLFELRLHAQNEVNDLVVYTAQTSWTLPLDMWLALSTHIVDQPITMTIRGGVLQGSSLGSIATGSSGPMTIAPYVAYLRCKYGELYKLPAA